MKAKNVEKMTKMAKKYPALFTFMMLKEEMPEDTPLEFILDALGSEICAKIAMDIVIGGDEVNAMMEEISKDEEELSEDEEKIVDEIISKLKK